MAKQQAGLLSVVALFQLGCNPSTLSTHLPEANVKKQNPSDQDQMKHVEAFASSDETAAAKAWKVLERYDRHSLIRELTRLYGAAAAVDHHRVPGWSRKSVRRQRGLGVNARYLVRCRPYGWRKGGES